MDPAEHWNRVYSTRRPEDVSWFRPHLETSLELIRATGVAPDAAIVDVGGGASTLVDDLLSAGYRDVTVIDLSAPALDAARARLGPASRGATWLTGDITAMPLEPGRYQVWHDRAVFHFLTDAVARERYVEQVRRAVAPGGYVIIGTFGPEGPERCSGLPTARYTAPQLHHTFGPDFDLLAGREETHRTPAGIYQQFVYCL